MLFSLPQLTVVHPPHARPVAHVTQQYTTHSAEKLSDEVQRQCAQQVADWSKRYCEEGHFIIPRSFEQTLAAARAGRFFVALDDKQPQATVVASCILMPLTEGVYELGTLIKAANYMRLDPYTAAAVDVVKEALLGAQRREWCVLATSRNARTSGRCLYQGGMTHLKGWDAFPALAALTCDPTCRSTEHGGAWRGADARIQCDAQNIARPDGCGLYVGSEAQAFAIDARLQADPRFHEQGQFSARRMRTALGLAL